MRPKITLSNVLSFIEGHSKEAYNKLIGLPAHIQEQVTYRHEKCKNDCMIDNKCKECGCNAIGKHFVVKSCNDGERFPDLMGKDEWEQYKKEMETDE